MPWIRSPIRNRPLSDEVYREVGCTCFITVRAAGRQRPFTRSDLNDATIGILLAERERVGCALHAYCLMPDHLHLVVSTRMEGRSPLDFINRFKGRSTRVSWDLGHQGRLWQPRFYDHVLRCDEDLASVCEYILANPVRAGLVSASSDYRWMGLVDPITE